MCNSTLVDNHIKILRNFYPDICTFDFICYHKKLILKHIASTFKNRLKTCFSKK